MASFSLACLPTVMLTLQFVCSAGCFLISENDNKHSSDHWTYDNQDVWTRQCRGEAQSPIDIQQRLVTPNGRLKLHFYNYDQLTRFKIINDIHTVRLSPIDPADELLEPAKWAAPGGDQQPTKSDTSANSSQLEPTGDELEYEHRAPSDTNSLGPGDSPSPKSQTAGVLPYGGKPSIKLDWLDDGNNEFNLKDVHFHWGERRDNGSEHAIDGRRAAMEMHLVHIKNGLEPSQVGYTSDSLAVVAVLIESYRKSNADFNPIVNALTRGNASRKALEIEYKSINDLLPNNLEAFYTYSGSLTTPPCYQVVNWIVMSERLYLNAKQIEMFRNLYSPEADENSDNNHEQLVAQGSRQAKLLNQPFSSHHQEPPLMVPNIRRIQPVNNRTIMSSFSPSGRLLKASFDQQLDTLSSSAALPATNYLICLLIVLSATRFF